MTEQEMQEMMEEIDLNQFKTEELEEIVQRTLERKTAKVESLKQEIPTLEGHEKAVAETLLVTMLYEVKDIRNVIDGSEPEEELPPFTEEMDALYDEACLGYVDSLSEEEAREEAITNQIVQGAMDALYKEVMSKIGMDILNHPKLARSVVKDTDIPWMLGVFVMGNAEAKARYLSGSTLDKKDLEEIRKLDQ
jgi:hypothetical protein